MASRWAKFDNVFLLRTTKNSLLMKILPGNLWMSRMISSALLPHRNTVSIENREFQGKFLQDFSKANS